MCLKGPVYDYIYYPYPVSEYPINLMKENYKTQRDLLSEPIPENLTYYLGPSEIQGMFALPAQSYNADSIRKSLLSRFAHWLCAFAERNFSNAR